jgi:hypothetical protein
MFSLKNKFDLLYDTQHGPYSGTTSSKRAMASSIYVMVWQLVRQNTDMWQHFLYDAQTGPYNGTTNSKGAMASSIYVMVWEHLLQNTDVWKHLLCDEQTGP